MRKPVVHTEGRTELSIFQLGSAELAEVKSGNKVVVQQVSRCEWNHKGSRYVVQKGNIFLQSLSVPNHTLNFFFCCCFNGIITIENCSHSFFNLQNYVLDRLNSLLHIRAFPWTITFRAMTVLWERAHCQQHHFSYICKCGCAALCLWIT